MSDNDNLESVEIGAAPEEGATITQVSFTDLGLHKNILRALTETGYEIPSPIQAECIPVLCQGRDLLGIAQTGTGKTAAFALPILQRLNLKKSTPQALVLTPTRELAIQVAEAFARYARHLSGFHVLPIYGGQSYSIQLKQLARGAHVIVGTPGRVMDHLERGNLSFADLTTLVLDEADEMLRMGFIDSVQWILEHTPSERQTALFSATMPEAIRRVAQNYLLNPEEVKIRAATQTVSAVRQFHWQVSGMHNKLDALTRILEAENELDAALIFVRTKLATDELAQKLEARGYSAAALNGDMNQQARERTIEQLKSGALDIVVATDVAARGIDVPRISHVINYDIPYDVEAYVHRIGRTGRAGRSGVAILFVAPRELRMLRMIERITRQPIEHLNLPSQQDVTNRRVALFKEKIAKTLTSEDLDFFSKLVEEVISEQEVAPETLAAALAFMTQRERPLRLEEKPFDRHARPERLPREFGSRPPRDFNDRPPRDFNERPPRDFGDRPPRDERPPRERFGRPPRSFEQNELPSVTEDDRGNAVVMARYRIDVGRVHGVSPRDIVGAIANEGNLPSRLIGRIDLYDEFSTVDLPNDLSPDILQVLRQAWVRRRQLNIAKDDGQHPPRRPFERKPRSNEHERKSGHWQDRPPRGFSPEGRRPPPRRRDHE